MKLNKIFFENNYVIEITNVRNINNMEDSPSIVEVIFDDAKTFNRVVVVLDGIVIGVNERFTFINNWLKQNPSFDTIVTNDIKEFEL